MENLNLIKIVCIALVICCSAISASAQNTVCNDDFTFKLVESNSSEFSINLSNDFSDEYIFKLYDITESAFFVDEKNYVSSSNEEVIFSKLKKKNVYLIKVNSKDSKCQFTIGGMEGIKFQ